VSDGRGGGLFLYNIEQTCILSLTSLGLRYYLYLSVIN